MTRAMLGYLPTSQEIVNQYFYFFYFYVFYQRTDFLMISEETDTETPIHPVDYMEENKEQVGLLDDASIASGPSSYTESHATIRRMPRY